MEIIVNHLDYVVDGNKILNNLYIEFEVNKINGIIGKTGCGKTTLLKVISTLKKPNSGTIKIGKYSIEKDNNKDDIDK